MAQFVGGSFIELSAFVIEAQVIQVNTGRAVSDR
jgi:hypothetical protein